jgi:soluble lytic murein transglycosylase-like protein
MLLKTKTICCVAAAAALFAATAAPLFGRESVCLNTGFCLTADSHTLERDVYVLHTGSGTMEFPSNQIAEITVLPDLPNSGNGPSLEKAAIKSGNSAASFDEMLIQAALQQGLEPEFVRSVARIESNLRQDAISNKGAIGLMQLMPDTAVGLGVDAHDAADNILGGAKFLRELLLRYNGDPALALAAYNAGPGAVQRYNGVPPYLETHKYIIRVLQEYKKLQESKPKAAATARTPSATN